MPLRFGVCLSFNWFFSFFLLYCVHRYIIILQELGYLDTHTYIYLYTHTYIHILYLNTIRFKAQSLWGRVGVTVVTPFIERSEGCSLRSVGVLDQSQQECRFFRRNSNPLQTFQLQPKRETSSSSLEDQLEKRSIISPSNRTICAGLRDTSGFRPVPVTTVAPTN